MRRWVLLFAYAGPLVAGAQALPAPPPAKEAPASPLSELPVPPEYRWDLPEVIEVIDIPGEQVAMGIPMKLNAVRSHSPFNKAYQHILDSFHRARLYVAPPADLKIPLSDPMLTGLDSFRMISYSVIFKPNPDGTTTLILGEAHVGRRQKQQKFFAPLPPGAESPMQSSVEGMRTLVFSTSKPTTEMEGYYRKTLSEAGFREIEPLLFRKDRTLWRVRVSKIEGKTVVSIIDSAQLPTQEFMTVQ